MECTNAVKQKKDKFWVLLIIVIALVILLRIFVFELVNISGESMYPTLHSGQMIAIYKVNYTPARGDIIVLDSPNKMELVKRVIGLPGETIEIKDGLVYINGQELDQQFQFPSKIKDSMAPVAIPPDSIFVMGDNRDYSSDSRMIGPIKIQSIRGKMAFELW